MLFTKNKLVKWLNAKSPNEVNQLLKKAHTVAPEFRRLYHQRRQQMQEEHAKLLLAKEQALFSSQQRKLRQREKLTQDIIEYGLWQTSDDISRGLS